MKEKQWVGESFRVWALGCALAVVVSTSQSWAHTTSASAPYQKFAGVEIGNGSFVMGEGDSHSGEVSLPSSVRDWTRHYSDTYTELVAPSEAPSTPPTTLRISIKDVEQDEEDLKELEELGWRRFNWADMDGLRLERLHSRNRALRALEVKLFRETKQAIELVLIGNKKSSSFTSLYEWLTPKKEETDKP